MREYHGLLNTTLTFDWDPPQGSGLETIVDSYTIAISSRSQSNHTYDTIVVESHPVNVTLNHNMVHSINITAENCAGQSDAYIHFDIEYGKFSLSVDLLWRVHLLLLHFNSQLSSSHPSCEWKSGELSSH